RFLLQGLHLLRREGILVHDRSTSHKSHVRANRKRTTRGPPEAGMRSARLPRWLSLTLVTPCSSCARPLPWLVCLSHSHSTLAFTICFSTFLLIFINWRSLLFCSSSTCDDVIRLRRDVWSHPGTFDYLAFLYFSIFCLYWLWSLFSF